MREIVLDIVRSWNAKEGINKTSDLLKWILEKNNNTKVKMDKISLKDCDSWYISDEGFIVNNNSSFFSIGGIKKYLDDKLVEEQPVIHQHEIGYLGLICKKINGVIHFLMQAKIEPGNVNKVQISPTIQATKSNFEQKHGGRKPAYLDYFKDAKPIDVVVDQIQSEQASRFYKKRNRNIIIYIEDDVPVLSSHAWMTLGQIKELMKIDNLVNMDTRTVLSCIPFAMFDIKYEEVKELFNDKHLCRSLFNNDNLKTFDAFSLLNNCKMFNEYKHVLCNLSSLSSWRFTNEMKEFSCIQDSNFKVVFYRLEIEGREVIKWDQPLCEAYGSGVFALFVSDINGKYEFLCKATPEIGSFDTVELGPTIQNEYNASLKMLSNEMESILKKHLANNDGVLNDVLLSEEGGRFYQEQNRNIIVKINPTELPNIPKEYIWLDLRTLNHLIQNNNVLNIQLRNLLSLLEN